MRLEKKGRKKNLVLLSFGEEEGDEEGNEENGPPPPNFRVRSAHDALQDERWGPSIPYKWQIFASGLLHSLSLEEREASLSSRH